MKLKKIILIAILALIAIPIVYAAESTSFFKYGEPAEIRRECFNDGYLCTSNFNCTITVYDKNANVIFDNVRMNRTVAYYNVTIEQLLDVGQYRSRMTCTDGGDSGSEIFYFSITASGSKDRQDIFLILVIGSIILLVLAFLLENNILGIFSGVLFIFSGVYTMIYGINGVYDIYSRAVAGIIIGLGLILTMVSSYELIRDTES